MPNCVKLCKHCVKTCHSVSNCAQLCTTVSNNKPIILFLMIENYLCQTIPKCSEVCESVRNCAQLYRKQNYIYFKQLKMIYAKLCKRVPHCSKRCQSVINLCKMSETYLLGHSLAQFYTVKHTYARLSTEIISTRVPRII